MKLDYHPPHLILNHFPSALFPVEFAFAAIGFYRQDISFSYAAFYALSAGVCWVGWQLLPNLFSAGIRTGLNEEQGNQKPISKQFFA